MITVFIPARGGSKRIPRKNLQFLGDKRLVEYPINLGLRLTENVIVSTDSQEIAGVASALGAEITLRSSELAADDVTLDQLIAAWLPTSEIAMKSDSIVVLLPTNPFVRFRTLVMAGNASSIHCAPCLAGARTHETYWYKSVKSVDPMESSEWKRIEETRNSQSAKMAYLESGAFSIFSPKHFMQYGTRRPKFATIFPVDKMEAFDIDDGLDLEIAKSLFPYYAQLNHLEKVDEAASDSV